MRIYEKITLCAAGRRSDTLFYLDYLAMMGLFIWIAHYLSAILQKSGKKKRIPQTNGKTASEKAENKKMRNMEN